MVTTMLKETELSLEIARREGGANNLNIGDIKEVQRILLDIVCSLDNHERELFIKHHIKLMKNRLRREQLKVIGSKV